MCYLILKRPETLILIFLISVFFSCKHQNQKKLLYLGQHEISGNDTMFYEIPPFSFVNQDSIIVDNNKLAQSIYIVDFFYTNCPSICPIVTSQMLRIYDKYEKENSVKLISFALDPQRDNITSLKKYAENIGVDSRKWSFLTGNKDEIWKLADKYFVSVAPDPNDLGEISHSGKIILVDKDGHIRGFAEGTDTNEVTAFLSDIDLLVEEYNEIK